MNREWPPILMLGAGLMGAPMARRLHDKGLPVSIWNRSPEKLAPLASDGIATVETLAALDTARRVVIVMVSDGPAAEAALFGAANGAAPFADRMARGSTVICMSSIPVDIARAHAAAFGARGVAYIDAPVSGGEKGAIEGTLTIMAGGESPDIEAMRPIFDALGRSLTHVGPAGSGQLAKIANQMIVGVTIGAVAEALLLAKAGGADPAKVREALLGGFADSAILRQHGARMIAGDFKPGGRSVTQRKDLRTAVSQARATGLDLPLSALVRDLYEEMCADGRGDLDHSALFLLLGERRAR